MVPLLCLCANAFKLIKLVDSIVLAYTYITMYCLFVLLAALLKLLAF